MAGWIVAKKIKKLELNEDLAELVGIHLGDGTLTPYFLRVTGDKNYDLNYFEHVSKIAENILGFNPSIRAEEKSNQLYLEIRSVKFCDYLHSELKIPFGDKIRGKALIPDQVLYDKKLAKECLRGLIDTDGSISRRNNSMCLAFDSRNSYLLDQAWGIGKDLKVFTYKGKEQIGTNAWLNVVKYFEEVGSSNQRHIIRFVEKYANNRCLYKKETLKYQSKYKNVSLPFKLGLWSSG